MINNLIIEPENKNIKTSFVAIFIEGVIILEGKTGLAHLVEHLHFNSVKNGQYLLDAYNIQAEFNAYTTVDHVCYFMTVPNENLLQAIKLICKIINKFTVTKKRIIDENKIVLEEQYMCNDNPEIWLYNKSMENIYKGHPLEKVGIDIPDTVPYYNISEIVAHGKKFYNKDNLSMVICSSISKKRISDYLDKMPFTNNASTDGCAEINKPPPYILSIESATKNKTYGAYGANGENGAHVEYYKYTKKFSKIYILINYVILYNKTIDLKTLLIRDSLIHILGDTGISELFDYLRLKKRLVYGISARLDRSIYHSSVNIMLSIAKKNVEKSIQEIFKVIDNIKSGKLEIDFNIHKKNIIEKFINDMNKDNKNLVNTIYTFHRTYNIATNYGQILHIFQNITLHDVVEEARKIFVQDARCSVHHT